MFSVEIVVIKRSRLREGGSLKTVYHERRFKKAGDLSSDAYSNMRIL